MEENKVETGTFKNAFDIISKKIEKNISNGIQPLGYSFEFVDLNIDTIYLYTSDCPKSKILKEKLKEKRIRFKEEILTDGILPKGITEVPTLQICLLTVDGEYLSIIPTILNYEQALKWIEDEETR